MLRGAVDVGGAAPAAFVRHRTAIAEPGQHQTVRDPAGRGVVSGEPGDRTDRPGHEEEPERVAPLAIRQQERELSGHGQARAVVVRERGMTRVRRHQDLAVGRARKDELAVRQGAAIVERRVDADLVLAVVERRGVVGRQAEPPGAGVVGRAVRDPGRSVRERVQVLAQLGERHAPVDGFAVADDVQVVRRGVDDPRAVGARDPRGVQVPLGRHGPVEHGRAGRHLVHLDRQVAGEHGERGPDAVAGDAARQREQFGNELVDVAPGVHRSQAIDALVGEPQHAPSRRSRHGPVRAMMPRSAISDQLST